MFDHPYLPGYKCIRQNLGATAGQHIIQSDSAFNAITYGLGGVESYGYNAGTLVKNLRATGSISNVLASSTVSYTCNGTPFRFSIKLSVKPTNLVWHFSQVPGLTPAVDLSQASPVPSDSSFNNGQWYYVFNVSQDYTINGTGTFTLPISVTHPSLEGCSNSLDFTLPINVIPAPVVDFSYTFPGCVNGTAQFNGTGTSSNNMPINTWNWNFGDGSTATGTTTPTHQWTTPGNYSVSLRGVTADGCVDDTTKIIGVSLPLTVSIVPDSIPSCNGSSVSLAVQNPVAGATYNWYTDATAGTLVHTGSTYTFTVTGPVSYYVEGASASGCISLTRKKVSVYILPNITTPTVVADSIGAHAIRFSWNVVPNATGYQVSTDNGATWITPSSGATGLTHTVTGLQIGQAVTLTVRALGGCVPGVSQPVTALTINDAVFIPNSFTPNGDGLNDVLKVYGNFIKTMKISIFNQWGEKIFESQSQLSAWDGTQKGKPQPSGVYMYVCDVILNDGTKLQRKGAINLIR
jgi:gliding motility-associated-like protein